MATIRLAFSGDTPTGVAITDVTRLDTGDPVELSPALPQAMTEDGGSWVFTFDEPAPDLAYSYAYTITWDDATTSDETGTIAGASGTYSTNADVDNAYGSDNVTAWASLNPDYNDGEIAARKAWARGEAKILIDEELTGAGLTAPATSVNFTFYDSLRSIEAELAGVLLYQSRGIRDAQGNPGDADGAMQGHYDRAMGRLRGLVVKAVELDDDDDTAAAGTFQFIPIRRGSATDEYSSN